MLPLAAEPCRQLRHTACVLAMLPRHNVQACGARHGAAMGTEHRRIASHGINVLSSSAGLVLSASILQVSTSWSSVLDVCEKPSVRPRSEACILLLKHLASISIAALACHELACFSWQDFRHRTHILATAARWRPDIDCQTDFVSRGCSDAHLDRFGATRPLIFAKRT